MKSRLVFLAASLLAAARLHAQSPAPSAPSSSPAETDPAAGDLAKFSSADALWAHLDSLKQPAAPPSSREELMALVGQMSATAAEFQKRYPQDPRRWDAKLISLELDANLARMNSEHWDYAKQEAELKEVASAKDAPTEAVAQARLGLIELHGMENGDLLSPAQEAEIVAFLHDYPDDPRDGGLQALRLKTFNITDPPQADALRTRLLHDPNPAVARIAAAATRLHDLTTKPLDLKFTALDGSEVDLGKLRGKVVLIDFWATWCGPCMGEVPKVVAAYRDLHAKGFEIVGISLDQDKGAVESVTKEQGMVWPQYFDGKGWESEIGSRYGIHSIPAMWLVDKKGMVASTDAREGLKEEVEKLLAR